MMIGSKVKNDFYQICDVPKTDIIFSIIFDAMMA
jgi:hypothetical protein